MINRIICMCAVLAIASAKTFAGKMFDLKSITKGEFKSETMTRVFPLPDGETYSQISSDKKQIVLYSFKTGGKVKVLFDANTARGNKIDAVDGYTYSPDGKKILIQTNTEAIYRRSFQADHYIFDINNNTVEPLSTAGPQQAPLFSPDGTMIAFVRDNNIFLVKLLYGNAESQVTKDGAKNKIINGVPDWVNEEELTAYRSMVFTADSKQLCWIRYDETEVKEFAFQLFEGSNPTKAEYTDYPGLWQYKYPKAGYDNSIVSVKSFDIKSRQTRTMQLPLKKDDYIPRIVMTQDPAKIAVFTLNRHQDHLSIYAVNPLSTVCKLLIEDKDNKYIKCENIVNTVVSDKFIVLPSDRDGFTHLYVYNHNGQQIRKIADGNYDITDLYGIDENTGSVYYAANVNGPEDKQIYVTDKNGKTTLLSKNKGYNEAIFSKGFKYYIQTWSDMNTPPVFTVNDNKGKILRTVIDNKELGEKFAEYAKAQKELFSFTTQEGVKLNGWMVKPASFDATKRYPVIMYQYGGPGSQQVLNSWNIGMCGSGAVLEQYFAQEGYIVVCVDNRGTGGRGAEFEKCTYLKLGQLEAKDQVETAIWLGQQSYVDKSRIGIWGWSFGGWNTIMSMSEGRPVFRAGVAIAPPTHWKFYDTIYTERYMRTPKENPSGYEFNAINSVSKLHGALLLCHGMADDNVHYQNITEYTEALVQADKDFKQNIYTNRNHSIFGGNTRNHLFRQVLNFFNSEMKQTN